jgi:Lon protease-like protein
MSADVERDFPLFPLGLVALPGELIPLHIFEERYKAMMNECIEAESEFGIVWLSDDGLKTIGCAARIETVLERMDDGRLNLVARGTRPFRVLERIGHLAYPAGVIEFVHDRGEEVDPSLEQSARDAYGELVKRAADRAPDAAELAEMDAQAARLRGPGAGSRPVERKSSIRLRHAWQLAARRRCRRAPAHR